MPVVLPAAGVLTALLLLALAFAATIIVVALLERIEIDIPHIGSVGIPRIDRIARAVERTIRTWVAEHVRLLVGWIDNVATHLREFPFEVAETFTRWAKAFDHYAHVVVHDVIKAFLRPVRTVANAAAATATAAAAGLVDLRADARAWVRAAEAAATAGLADLRGDVRGWIADARRDLTAAIGAVAGTLHGDVLPRLGTLEDIVPGLRGAIDDLRGLYNRVAEWFLPIAAVFSGAAALALLRHVNDCRARSDRLCQTDPSFLDELLGLAFLGASMSEIQAFVRSTAPAVSSLADEFIDRS